MIIYAAPETFCLKGTSKDCKSWAFDLQTAINRAAPGDTVQLLPGRYTMPVQMTTSGQLGAPIKLVGPKTGRAILDGGGVPQNARNIGLKPMDGEFAFIKVFNARRLILRGLTFVNNWPTSIYLRGASDITVQDCDFKRGRFAIYARQGKTIKTERLLIEKCHWIQDPEHQMWRGEITWENVKSQQSSNDASHFNGAFFGSYNISGDVTIRSCQIRHAFNAVRMDMDDKLIKVRGTEELKIPRNRDVAIYDNDFSFIRDNAVEPESGAESWYVFNNRFLNIHGTFSLDQVSCQDMFYLGNTILNNRKPEQGNTDRSGGVIFKFFKATDADDNPPLAPRTTLWSAYNSVQTRTSYVKKGATMYWRDAYNAVGLYNEDHPDVTAPPRVAFNNFGWKHGDVVVRGMATNDCDYPQGYPVEKVITDGIKRLIAPPFEIKDTDPDPDACLGGWNGRLKKSKALAALKCPALRITRMRGRDFHIPAGLSPGAHPIETLYCNFGDAVALPRY